MKKLRDAIVGDTILVLESAWNDKPRRQTIHTVAKVNRVNLVASDGRIWNRESGCTPGSENQGGYIATAEAWDEDVHPFLDEQQLAFRLLKRMSEPQGYFQGRDRAKQYAKALPYLRLAAKELGLEVQEKP